MGNTAIYLYTCLLGILFMASCAPSERASLKTGRSNIPTDTTHLDFTVEPAPEWTALFDRQQGWFGADGIFSIPCNGVDTAGASDSTLFLFSDTMIGDIADGKLKPGSRMVHNSVAYMKGNEPDKDHIRFYWATDKNGGPATLFVPHTPASSPQDYFWLGDGFVDQQKNNTLYIFAYRIRNVSQKDFGFRQVGSVLIALPAGSRPPFREQRQVDAPLFIPGKDGQGSGYFGSGIFVNTRQAGASHPDGFVYVYGIRGHKKEVMVARVKPAYFEDFSRWRYWDGKEWSKDIQQAAAITDRASDELSLTPLPDGRYALVFQINGMSPAVGLRLGLSPVGPFGPVIKVWDCPEPREDKHFFTYNAKAHPGLSKPGELLISYNVNSFDFLHQLHAHPHLYRPRFIKVKLLP